MSEYKVEYVKSKDNLPNVKINNFYIHSKYRPIEEAQKIMSTYFENHYTIILFGYGAGYIVDEFLKVSKNEPLIIIDPLVSLGDIQVKQEHLNHERIYFWDESKDLDLRPLLGEVSLGLKTSVKLITTSYYDKLFITYYKEILEVVRDYLVKTQVNINTIGLFSDAWQENLSKNLLHILKDPTLFNLEKSFECPVVIASGGPSLSKQLPKLKEIQNQVIIIASGTTINTLLKYGIKPHYVVSIDGADENFESFLNLDLEGVQLIYTPFNHWKIRSLFEEGFSFTSTIYNSIAKYIYRVTEKQLPLVIGGGTVAHFAFSIAQSLTSGPIAFVGQDLAFTNNVTHAENNPGRKKIENLNEALFEIEDYFGDTVLTDGAFLSMKNTFEEMAIYYGNSIEFYNCTEGGAKIKGFPQLSFQQFIEQFVSEPVFSIRNDKSKDSSLNLEPIVQFLEKELEATKKLEIKLTEGLKTLKSNKSKTNYSSKMLKKLDSIDMAVSELVKEVQMEFLLQPMMLKIESAFLEKKNETPEEKYLRSYKQSEFLYKELLNMLEKSRKNIREVIEIATDKEKTNEFYRHGSN